jgi:hypothetical protein
MQSTTRKLKHLAGVATAGLLGTVVMVGAAQAAVANAPPSILVFNQKPAGSQVSVDYVNIPASGYVVVYAADAEGKPTGAPLGSVAVNAGSHMDLKVTLSAAPAPGTNLWASLYKDKDGKEGFDKKGDKAVWSQIPMQNAFTVQ